MEVLQRTANRGSISTDTGYNIDNSLKLESDNSEYLKAEGRPAGNQQIWTWSCWLKRTEVNNGVVAQYMFSAGSDGKLGLYFRDDSSSTGGDTIFIYVDEGNSLKWIGELRVSFRDTSAWYHIVFAVDSTDGTAADRTKIYVNGVQQTITFNATLNQNSNTRIGDSGGKLSIGAKMDGSYEFNGYMAEVVLVDGSQLTPTSFGEFDDDSGIWKPKDVSSLSLGNAGFYMNFDDSSNLGKVQTGTSQGNFDLYNITAADQATDTPTNNGCTLNVLASLEGSNDITEGALVSTGKAGGGGNFNGTYGTMGIDPFNSSVDWYWEIETSIGTSGSDTDIGIGWIKESRITSGSTAYNNVYADGISRYSSQTANAAGDIWGVLLETGTTPVMKLYRNDGLIYTSTHGSGGVSFDTLMFPYITVKGTNVDARLNFLNPASSFSIASGNADPNGYGNFEFDPKGGYALCTKNLAEYG